AGPRDRGDGRLGGRAGARLGPSARGRPPPQVRPAAPGGAGGRGFLRPRGPGGLEVAAAAARRPDGRVRDELPQARRRRTGRGGTCVADARAPYRAAEAHRGDGRGRDDVLERARVPALLHARVHARRTPALHAHRRGADRPRHRRVARRAGGEDPVLERVQASGPLVGRAPAVLGVRAAAFGALAALLGLYYAFSETLWNASDWWDVTWLAFVLMPAFFALV